MRFWFQCISCVRRRRKWCACRKSGCMSVNACLSVHIMTAGERTNMCVWCVCVSDFRLHNQVSACACVCLCLNYGVCAYSVSVVHALVAVVSLRGIYSSRHTANVCVGPEKRRVARMKRVVCISQEQQGKGLLTACRPLALLF